MNGVRVLLVEDHAALADTGAGGSTTEGLAVGGAYDRLDALWRAREHP